MHVTHFLVLLLLLKHYDYYYDSCAGGFVGEHEAGQRLFQVAHDPRCAKSGVYWSWNGGPREGRGKAALEKGGQISGGGGAGGGWDSIFENDQSAKVLDVETALKLFQYSTEITGAEWPNLRAITSPCPTLNVVGAITKGMVQREELKRMREMGRPGMSASGELVVSSAQEKQQQQQEAAATAAAAQTKAVPQEVKPKLKLSKRKRAFMAVDRVVTFVASNTLGRVARFAGKRVLGEIPEEAVTGSFQPVAADGSLQKIEDSQKLLEQEVAPQLTVTTTTSSSSSASSASVVDKEDEALFEQIYSDNTSSGVNGTVVSEKPAVGV